MVCVAPGPGMDFVSYQFYSLRRIPQESTRLCLAMDDRRSLLLVHLSRIMPLGISLFQKQYQQRYDRAMEVVRVYGRFVEYAHLWLQYVPDDKD